MTYPDLSKFRIVNDQEPKVALLGGGGCEGVSPEFAPDDPLDGLAVVGTPRGVVRELRVKKNITLNR